MILRHLSFNDNIKTNTTHQLSKCECLTYLAAADMGIPLKNVEFGDFGKGLLPVIIIFKQGVLVIIELYF